MALSKDEQKLLDELTAKAAAADPDEDWEMEIFAGDKGARIPFSKGKDWLFREFGIGDAPAPPAGDGQGEGQGEGQGDGGKGPARGSYFGKRAAGTAGKP